VQTSRGLVEERVPRPRCERPREPEKPPLAVWQRGGPLMTPLDQAEALEQGDALVCRFVASEASRDTGEHHVLEHRQPTEDADALEGSTQTMPDATLHRPPGGFISVEEDSSAVDLLKSRRCVDEGRLAG